MIVGVTGGIGAGKSTVCEVFEDAGAFVIDADSVGHETILDSAVIGELADEFGREILDADGQIIRRELGRRAFASDEGRKKLNAIVWPLLRQLLLNNIEISLQEDAERSVVVDAALLVERGDPKKLVDVLVVVTAPEALRIERTMERLGLSEAEVKSGMDAQLAQEYNVAVADFVVANDDTPDVCRNRALAVWNQIVM